MLNEVLLFARDVAVVTIGASIAIIIAARIVLRELNKIIEPMANLFSPQIPDIEKKENPYAT